MKGFVFAAGYGERLRPITERIPKPLVPVLNVPSICYSLLLLKKAGISDVVINLHYKMEDIIGFFCENSNFGFNINFSTEEVILGTGGGLKKCERLLSDDDFVVLNSDVIMDLDIRKLITRHQAAQSYGTVVLYGTSLAKSIGPVGVKDNRVVDFKNYLDSGVMSDYIYTGAAVLSPRIFQYLTTQYSSVVYTGYTSIIKNHRLDYFEHEGLWEDIGNVESYRRANLNVLASFDKLQKEFREELGISAEIVSTRASIHKEAVVNNTIIGDGCVVGKGSKIDNSVLFAGSKVAEDSRIIDAVVMGDSKVVTQRK
jgi:mannose-1-phosphate guanylyltransferase